MLRRAAGRRAGELAGASALVAGHQLAEAAVPVAVGWAIDLAVATEDGVALLRWVAVLAGVFAVLATCGFFAYWLVSRSERMAAHGLRMDVAARVLHPAGGAPGRSGELVSLAGSDAERSGLVCQAIATAVGALAALAGGAVVLFDASLLLGLVVLGGVPVVMLASRLLSRPLVARAEAEQAALAAATGVATTSSRGCACSRASGPSGPPRRATAGPAAPRCTPARLRPAGGRLPGRHQRRHGVPAGRGGVGRRAARAGGDDQRR
ncbi:hypothetical protein BJF78_18615 [Pseudonocardia sp. CNS-139]|nr:hypothetical protein BJF78_18615 [Pseudonocardia sp. CNS-139]